MLAVPNRWGIYAVHVGTLVFLNLTEVFPCFFLSCKVNATVKTSKDGARPALFHISCYLRFSVDICVALCIVCV